MTLIDVKIAYSTLQPNGHWFDRETLKFFHTKFVSKVYTGPGGVFFVTSEYMDSPKDARYTIRQQVPSGKIKTRGDFQGFTSKYSAIDEAKRLAKG